MTKKEKTRKVRIQFDFHENLIREMDELKDDLGCASRAELMRRAVKLLGEVRRLEKTGTKLRFSDPNTGKDTRLTFVY